MTVDDDIRWDTTRFFPGLESREYLAAEEAWSAGLDRLLSLYDQHGVRRLAEPIAEPTGEQVAAFEEVLDATNIALDDASLLRVYVTSFVSTDSTDATAQTAMARLRARGAELSKLTSRFDAWVGSFDADALIAASGDAATHEWPLRKASVRAEHQMTEAEEALAADMGLTGAQAWSRLFHDQTSAMAVDVDLPDGVQRLPIFAIRGLATSTDPATRKAAFEAELGAWEQHKVPLAAALNGVKGEQQLLISRRGWNSELDAQLHGQAVDRVTLEAMQDVVVESFPAWRRYFRAKASLLGHDNGLPWWELFAPVGTAESYSWDDAKTSVADAFGSYSPQLRALAERSWDDGWIDVAPRAGKTGGAFCMGPGDGTSMVLLNFNGAREGFMTLAHELGHAYHNHALTGRTPLQRGTPSSLAETASIFCETVMVEHGLATAADDNDRMVILDVDLQGSAQVIVDIHSRFLFESAVFDERRTAPVAPDRFTELMADAQEATYGSGLDPNARHPLMWALKPHYYDSLYYNWPYTYGLLFGVGLYARFTQDPERFRSHYDDLLASTGLGNAADLAARFDIDVRSREFWADSMAVLTARIDDFEALAQG